MTSRRNSRRDWSKRSSMWSRTSFRGHARRKSKTPGEVQANGCLIILAHPGVGHEIERSRNFFQWNHRTYVFNLRNARAWHLDCERRAGIGGVELNRAILRLNP